MLLLSTVFFHIVSIWYVLISEISHDTVTISVMHGQ